MKHNDTVFEEHQPRPSPTCYPHQTSWTAPTLETAKMVLHRSFLPRKQITEQMCLLSR